MWLPYGSCRYYGTIRQQLILSKKVVCISNFVKSVGLFWNAELFYLKKLVSKLIIDLQACRNKDKWKTFFNDAIEKSWNQALPVKTFEIF